MDPTQHKSGRRQVSRVVASLDCIKAVTAKPAVGQAEVSSLIVPHFDVYALCPMKRPMQTNSFTGE